jgi:uncharacterized membrane protein YhdT
MQLKKNRAFISTATAFTFVPTLLTSIMLLFHMKYPGVMDIHKWVGLAFIVLCMVHIPINWTVLRKHLSGRGTVPALVLTALLTVGMMVVGMTGDGGDRGHHGQGYANHQYRN